MKSKAEFVNQFRGEILHAAIPHLARLRARHAETRNIDIKDYLRLLDIKTAHLMKVAADLGLGEQTIQTILIDHRDTGDVGKRINFTIDGAEFSIINHPTVLARVYKTASRAL